MTVAPPNHPHPPSNVRQAPVQRQYGPTVRHRPAGPREVAASTPAVDYPAAYRMRLTEREVQVLTGMASGQPNKAIGAGLFISEDTVKTHGRRLFRKLGARDRAHAVHRGWELGILRHGSRR